MLTFEGVTAMARNWWTAKNLVFVVAIVSLACVAAVLAVGLAYPEPVSNAALGPDWQCSRLAFVWTTCTRLTGAGAASARVARERLATEPACPQPRT
jgi:hypothetical protein